MGIHGNQKELHGNRWKSEEIRRTKSMKIWRNRLGKYIYVPLWRGQYWHHWATYLLCRTDSASSLRSAWSRTQAKRLKIGLWVILHADCWVVVNLLHVCVDQAILGFEFFRESAPDQSCCRYLSMPWLKQSRQSSVSWVSSFMKPVGSYMATGCDLPFTTILSRYL